eukprot:TRINITY_DN447_c0_g2_i1.p1 TRINITY_DN447_c0_g2~~TRINITY_DN447_c0_g2_i1.p1  ORF type:complete len:190 (-),score=42.49 TRINITY_DN447_c0_g2_i1:174-743(-)
MKPTETAPLRGVSYQSVEIQGGGPSSEIPEVTSDITRELFGDMADGMPPYLADRTDCCRTGLRMYASVVHSFFVGLALVVFPFAVLLKYVLQFCGLLVEWFVLEPCRISMKSIVVPLLECVTHIYTVFMNFYHRMVTLNIRVVLTCIQPLIKILQAFRLCSVHWREKEKDKDKEDPTVAESFADDCRLV